jgi:hypothetical protein
MNALATLSKSLIRRVSFGDRLSHNNLAAKFASQEPAVLDQGVWAEVRVGGEHLRLSPALNWLDYPTMQKRNSTVNFLVCKQSRKAMPHACATYKNFWTDNQRLGPQTLASFSNSDWPVFTTCQ